MDLRLNPPAQPAEANLAERVIEGLREVHRRRDLLTILTYGDTAGSEEDRDAGARWLRPRIGHVDSARLLVSPGAQGPLTGWFTMFAKPGDTIVTEALTYPAIRALCVHFGVKLVGVACDDEGIIPDALRQACGQIKPRLLYCTPTIHNPTTATMSDVRRQAMARVAEEFDLSIFEDDTYGLLPSRAPDPIALIAPERTYYVTSLSKCIAPGLRIGYCVPPERERARLAEAVRTTTMGPPPLMAALASQWINDGSAHAILAAVRNESVARQEIAREVLAGVEFAAHPEGPHLWVRLQEQWSAPEELGIYLRQRGLAAKSAGFTVDSAPRPNGIRIALGASPDRESLRQGLRLLAEALDEPPAEFRAMDGHRRAAIPSAAAARSSRK